MREMNIPRANFAENSKQFVLTDGRKRRRWVATLYFSGITGIMFDLIGLLISAIAYFRLIGNGREFNRIGTWLMVAAFPLIMLGAHAMDKIGEIDEKAKRELLAADENIKIYEPLQWK